MEIPDDVLIISTLNFEWRGAGLIPDQSHSVEFLGRTLHFHRAFLYSGVYLSAVKH